MTKRFYIGLAASFHDPAIAIVDPEGRPLFAEATERFLQFKQAPNCVPDLRRRIAELVNTYCDRDSELVCAVSWSRKFLTLMTLATGMFRLAAPLADRLQSLEGKLRGLGWSMADFRHIVAMQMFSNGMAGVNTVAEFGWRRRTTIRRFDHHLCHAALAAYGSPFQSAVVAIVDGSGERNGSTLYGFENNRLSPLKGQGFGDGPRTHHAAGLGSFYQRVCEWCGFDPDSGEEWKVMGLAPYGKLDREIYDVIRPLLRVDGLRVGSGCGTRELVVRLEEMRRRSRKPGSPAESVADLAFTGQQVFEEVFAELLCNAHSATGLENVALGGGCALNSSWNGRVLEMTPFQAVHVPSAPADDGNALGAALLAFRQDHPAATGPRGPLSAYLGSSLSAKRIDQVVENSGLSKMTRGPDLHRRAAEILARGGIIGWARGRAEFGPRALGNRSILADARPADMKDRVNACVKHREGFRPFAPSILDEHGPRFFHNYQSSPYMERTLRFRDEMRALVPAVVHVNGTGRLQSVRKEIQPDFHALIDAYHQLTGIPLLLNTSFNVMGKPIIHSVEDALGVFLTSSLDALVLEDVLIEK